MAIAPVLKTGVRKGMGVRIPRSPSFTVFAISSHKFITSFKSNLFESRKIYLFSGNSEGLSLWFTVTELERL